MLDDQHGSGFALHVLGLIAIYTDEQATMPTQQATARTYWNESLERFRSVRDGWGQGQALFWLGNIAYAQRELHQAQVLWTDARDHFVRSGDTPALAWTFGKLGYVADALEDGEQAMRWYRQAVQKFMRLVELPGAGGMYVSAGIFARLTGDVAAAQEYSTIGLRLARDFGDPGQMAEGLTTLAQVAEERGDAAEAGRLWQESLAYWRQIGDTLPQVTALIGIGANANTNGNYRQAQACFTEALSLLPRTPHLSGSVVRSLLGLAGAAHGLQQAERAAYLGGAADATTARGGWTVGRWARYGRPLHDRTLASLRRVIAEQGLASLWEAGAALTLEQAIAYALAENESEPKR